MPKVKTTLPVPSKEKGQRSIDLPLYLTRYVPLWGNPGWMDGKLWREVVKRQPIAMDCRETLIANLVALDWKIEPKDSTQRDENKKEIEYYTNFFTNTQELDYTELIEWLCTDLLDIPFGCGAEVIREGDDPKGRVVSLIPLDGATLFPTQNAKYPVGQFVAESSANQTVYFPKHAINRMYISPRPDIKREGWGLAPPEKIYLALEMLNRGDYYYANLLIDTPAAGILDLGDMAKDSAEEWVKAWRKMLTGIDPFKIPVLYEHNNAVDWIPFTKNPAELMFDKAIARYGALVAAGYGMSLSDLGISVGVSGGETLAGSIRDERKTRKTGFARIKKKVQYWFDRLLPEYLGFHFIDLDDELNVALGRARLAHSTAGGQFISMGVFSAEEWRQQTIADGLVTISVPEKLPPELKNIPQTGGANERPGQLGNPVPVSGGGHGEVKQADVLMSEIYKALFVDDVYLLKKAYNIFLPVKVQADSLREVSSDLSEIWYEEILDGDQPSETMELFLGAIKSNYGDRLSIAFDRDLIVTESKLLLDEIYLEKAMVRQKKLFIRGEIDEIDHMEIVVFDEASDELANWLEEIINDTLEKSILLGTFRFALENPNTDLDNLIDGNVVNYIRNQSDIKFNDILMKFTTRISDIILETVKGDNNDNKSN
jgi:hypothetical protein